MKIINYFKYIVLLSILCDTLFGKDLDKVSLQLNWKYQFEFAGFIVAKEKGFYSDNNLDVELKEYKFGMNIVDEVLNNKSTLSGKIALFQLILPLS